MSAGTELQTGSTAGSYSEEPATGAYGTARSAPRPRRRPEGGGVAKGTPWLLGLLLILLSSALLPQAPPWLAVKTFALAAGGVLLAVWVFSAGDWTLERAKGVFRSPVNLCVLAFLALIGVSMLRSPLPEPSRFEAFRYLGGALVFFAATYGLSSRDALQRALEWVTLAAAIAGIVAFITYGEMGYASEGLRIAGAFRNEQLLGGFLCLVLPLVIAACFSLDAPFRRTGAQITVVIVLGALLASRNRSAWLGGLAGLLVLGLLWWRALRPKGFVPGRQHLVVPLVVLTLCVGALVWVGREGELFARRLSILAQPGNAATVQWRQGMWDKAFRMVRDQPVTGVGVGLFPLKQALYYHPGVRSRTQSQIAESGASLSESAHNSYARIAAELGVPGLLLYLGILVTFTWTVLRALQHEGSRFRRWLLVGSLAALAAQAVSAISSPAWDFPECSLFLWLALGLGTAAAGLGRVPTETTLNPA